MKLNKNLLYLLIALGTAGLVGSDSATAIAGLKRGAAPTPSTKVTVETYSAIDSDPESAPADDLTSQVRGASAGAPPEVKKAARKAKTLQTAPAPEAPAAPLGYDFVPEAQARAISKRLKLVEALLLRHQRAYDYRAYTVAQLQAIYAKLELEREVFAPPASLASPLQSLAHP